MTMNMNKNGDFNDRPQRQQSVRNFWTEKGNRRGQGNVEEKNNRSREEDRKNLDN